MLLNLGSPFANVVEIVELHSHGTANAEVWVGVLECGDSIS